MVRSLFEARRLLKIIRNKVWRNASFLFLKLELMVHFHQSYCSKRKEVNDLKFVILKYSLGSQRQESKIQNNLFKTFNLHPMLQV